jgi:hypothetical protein
MSDKEAKVLSFVGGVIFFSVVAVVVLSKDEGLRNEVKAQTQSLLKTSKKALQQFQSAVSKVGKLTGGIKSVKKNSNLDPEGEGVSPVESSYNAQWEQVQQRIDF